MKRHTIVSKLALTITIILIFGLLFLPSAYSQREFGDVGIGVQVGQPTGLTVKFYEPVTSVDILAAWDLDDFFFLNVHAIWDKHLNDANTVHFFYGVGGFIGLRDRPGNDNDFGFDGNNDDIGIGISGTAGIDFLIEKFEIYLQLTPRLELIEATDFDLGGGLGFRVYF